MHESYPDMNNHWLQKTITLSPKNRGVHLVTDIICRELPELRTFSVGICHLFMQHTSAGLSINENADSDVRIDMETYLNWIAPESIPGKTLLHTIEGPDDMPAHVKSSLLGCQLSIPISEGAFAFGTWQGIYLCECRNHATARRIVATICGLRKT